MSKSVSKFALAAGLVLAITFTFSCSGDDGGDNNTSTCGGKKYDITYYSCESGELVGSCRGKPYYPEFESCENGEIIDGAEISSSSSRNSSSSGGGLNMSDLPKQVYLVETGYENEDLVVRKKERYNGSVNVSVLFSDIVEQTCSCSESGCECRCTNTKGEIFECKEDYEYDTIPAGKIQNGQLSLNLPANLNSKYLQKLEPCNDEYCQSNISVVPRNLTYTRRSSLEATIPGKKECYLRPYRTKSGTTNRAQFYYFSESGSITGTETDIYEHEGDSYQTNFDMNFSKGWNLVYYDTYDNYRNLTTDIPKDGTWEWWLQCYDEDNSDPSSSSGVGEPVTYGNETYPTVVIGTQTWFAKNLNYAVAGSKCYGEDGEVVDFDEDYNHITKILSPAEVQANCLKYGRLYDWVTAMSLPPSCNESSCSSQIQSKHKGICPSGWHIPSEGDWGTLMSYVGGYETAGAKLKAASDWNWNDDEDKSGNGTDEYGFSALPGGDGRSDGFMDGFGVDGFIGVGYHGAWWSASECNSCGDNNNRSAHDRSMVWFDDIAEGGATYKSGLKSVRCVKD